jgi:hypothetical protein
VRSMRRVARFVIPVVLGAITLSFYIYASWAAVKARPPVFSGTVYLPNGQPARNATLLGHGLIGWYPVPKQTSSRPGALGAWGQTGGELPKITTDAQGRYRLSFTTGWSGKASEGDQARTELSMLLYSPDGLGYAAVGEATPGGVRPGAPLDIHLREGDRVSGRVVGYPGGQPLAGVEVEVGLESLGFLGHGRVAGEKVTTDAEGRFWLRSALPPKRYELTARSAGWGTMETESVPPLSETAAVRTVEIRLVRPYAVHGRAYGPDGKALRAQRISFGAAGFGPKKPGLLAGGFGGSEETTTDQKGAFEMLQNTGLPYAEGPSLSHYLALTPKLDSGARARAVVVDATDPATQTFELHFAAPGTIAGRQVEASTGKPAVGVRVRLVPVLPNWSARLDQTLEESLYDPARSTRKDDETGAFVLRGVAAGDYRLELEGLTIQDAKAIPVTVKAGVKVDAGTAKVRYVPHLTGQISGLPWKPSPEAVEEGVHAVLRPSGQPGPGREAYVDLWSGGGKCTVWANGRPAGRYDVALLAWRDNDRYVTQVWRGVELAEGRPREGLRLHFTRGATVRGKVLRTDDRPLAGTSVTVHGVSGDAVMLGAAGVDGFGPTMWIQVETDSKGGFAVQGLLPGEHEITAHPPVPLYGPQPTVRVKVRAAEQKRGVVLRTKRNG